MNFKSFSKNKNKFNIIFIIIDRLGKRVYLILYYKIVIVKETLGNRENSGKAVKYLLATKRLE